MDEAKRLLSFTQLSIKAVSARTGFGNSWYFSEIFRNRVGMSPEEFRQSLRGM